MNLLNQSLKLLFRPGLCAVLSAAAVALGVFGAVTPQATALGSDKTIFDFDDDPKPRPKPPVLVKPETPPATTPPATTPPATTPEIPAPPAPVAPAPEPPAPVKPKLTAVVTTQKGPPLSPGLPSMVEKVTLGLIAETYSGSSFEKMTGSRTTPRVNAKLTRKPDAPVENGVIPMSVRWRGLIRAPQAGIYKFRLVAPAQTTVRIGNEAVFWGGPAPATAFANRSVDLKDGVYPLLIETSNISGSEEIRLTLEWMLDKGFDWETVPAAALCRASTGGPGPNTAIVGPGTPKPTVAKTPVRPARATPLVKGTTKAPDDATIAEAKKRLRAARSVEFADQRPLARIALAKALRTQSQSASNIPDQFIMLREAAEQYALGGDIPAAMDTVQAAVAAYDIDEAAFALPAFTPIASKSGRSAEQADALAIALLSIADRALVSGNLDAAGRVADLAVTAARPSLGGTLRVKPKADRIKEIRAELLRLTPIAAKLKANPTDPEPNIRMGKFHALLTGNWDVGLPLLSKGSDAELKLLAEMEATNLDRAGQHKLADAWWDRAKLEKEPYASAARSRAAAWYGLLLPAENDAASKEKMNERMVAAADAVNLLAAVDPRRDGLRGQWRWAGRDLFCEGRGNCALQIPFAPKGDYDFGIEFTVTAGNIHINQLMPGAASSFGWRMYEYGMMFEYESAGGFGTTGGSGRSTGLAGRQRHVSVIRVRGNSVKAYVDGQLAGEWNGDASKIKGTKDWQLADPTMLGIGCLDSQIAVHAAKLVELPSTK
jgi:hypothetical protein